MQLQDDNDLPDATIAPLLRKHDNDSIIIFTYDPNAADRCIKQGIYAFTTLKSTPQDYRLRNATTVANMAIEQLNARTINDAENVEKTTKGHAIANIPANKNAATAMATMKAGITNAPHEPPSAAG
jgi:hypothetical protein